MIHLGSTLISDIQERILEKVSLMTCGQLQADIVVLEDLVNRYIVEVFLIDLYFVNVIIYTRLVRFVCGRSSI